MQRPSPLDPSEEQAPHWSLRKTLILLTAAVLGAAGAMIGTEPLYRWFEPATLFYEVSGIDVSHHQGPINWQMLSEDKVSFAFMKATEGDDFVDKRFEENWRGAKNAKITRGAYHFFTRCSSPEAQAENFIRTVPNEEDSLPHVIDTEHMGPCKSTKPTEDMASAIKTFLDITQGHYGKRPIIYTTREFHDAFLQDKLENERFWIRSLFLPPNFRKKSWIFWQHHNGGKRKGITTPVDLNVFRGTTEEFHSLANSRP